MTLCDLSDSGVRELEFPLGKSVHKKQLKYF